MSEMAPADRAAGNGYDRLVQTDPDDPNWYEIAREAVADGSAYAAASTTEDIRRRLADLRDQL